MSYQRVTGHLIGASARNGLPVATPGSHPRLTPQQREAARQRLIATRNATLRQRAARAWIRDVPRTCTCMWQLAHGAAFVVTTPDPDCPYHSAPGPEPATETEAAQRRAALAEANPGGVFRPGDPRIRRTA